MTYSPRWECSTPMPWDCRGCMWSRAGRGRHDDAALFHHRLAWLNGVADRYVVFDGGHIVQDYEADEFLSLSPGCGKTTLVHTLTGLIKPVSGRIELNGVPAKPRDLTRAGFLVMQDVNYQLFSDSVREELLIGHMEQVGELLRQLASQGKAILAVTHDEELAAGRCDRIVNLGADDSGSSGSHVSNPDASSPNPNASTNFATASTHERNAQ